MYDPIPKLIQPQPDEVTCGPTCLHALYKFYGEESHLPELIDEVEMLPNGGTLGSLLANHALKRKFDVTIYTYNITVFDPSWRDLSGQEVMEKLKQQLDYKKTTSMGLITKAYLEFLSLGGKLKCEDLSKHLLEHFLARNIPLLCGLSATCLYKSMREYGPNLDYDDIRGEPTGHFVVLHDYDAENETVGVADPIINHPAGNGNVYRTSVDRVINAILLGVITNDANIMVIQPPKRKR